MRLTEKKRLIDLHTSLATALLDHIKGRRLDVFFELEEKIMGGITLDKSIMEVVNDLENGGPEDKMRLFIIYFLCSPQMSIRGARLLLSSSAVLMWIKWITGHLRRRHRHFSGRIEISPKLLSTA